MTKKRSANWTKLGKYLTKYDWQDYVLLSGIIIGAVALIFLFSTFHNLPGPVYGGDVYVHYGHASHIAYGGNIFKSSHFLNEYTHYSPLTHFLTALLHWCGLSMLKASVFFPVVTFILAGFITYTLINNIFNNKNIALLSAFIWIFSVIPHNTPSRFTILVLAPLSILAVFFFKSPVLTGLVYGLCGVGHQVAFFGINLLIIFFVIYKIWNSKNKKDEFMKYLKHFGIVLLIGVPISLLYWGPLIFVYKGITINAWQEYVLSTNMFVFFIGVLKDIFFNTNSIPFFISSILAILGLFVFFKVKKYRVYLIPFFVVVLGILHPLITKPLLGTSLGMYGFERFVWIVRLIFASFGLLLIFKNLEAYNLNNIKSGFMFAVILFLVLTFLVSVSSYPHDKWDKLAFSNDELTQSQNRMADWIIENTDINNVFLTTHGETAFALNGLTGRKIVYMRRTHASPFVDLNQRILDASVMLYSQNKTIVKELVDKYNVEYFYIDYYSMTQLQQCSLFFNSSGDMNPEQSYSCLRVTADYESLLKKTDLNYIKTTARLNVARNDAPKFDLLIIMPNLNSYFFEEGNLEPLYATKINGEPVYILYKVNI